MSKAQLVITAVVLEGRSKSEVTRAHDVSRHGYSNWSNAMGPRVRRHSNQHSSRPTTILARSVRDSRKKIVRLSTATVAPSTTLGAARPGRRRASAEAGTSRSTEARLDHVRMTPETMVRQLIGDSVRIFDKQTLL